MALPNFDMFGFFEPQGRSDEPMACMICAPRPGGGFSGRKNGCQITSDNIIDKSYWDDPDISQRRWLDSKGARCLNSSVTHLAQLHRPTPSDR
jgi:hypothetical protein